MHNTVLFLIVSTFLCSCNGKLKKKESTLVENKVTVIKPIMDLKPSDISKILDSVKFIKLELTENSIIGEISKMVVFEDRIYILDKLTRSLFIYTLNGKFIFKISRIGNGPGEYSQLDFFDINYETRQIVFTDLMKYRILFYDLEGKFVSDKKIKFWIEGLTPTFNKGFVAYSNFRNNKTKLSREYNVVYLDSMMNISECYFPYDSKNYDNPIIKFITPQLGNFYSYNQNSYFFSPFKRNVYQITKNGLQPKYLFDFGDKSFNEEYLNQKAKLKTYMEQGEFCQLASVLENNGFVIFSFYQASSRLGQFGYYSKISGNVIGGVGFTVGNGIYFNNSNVCAYGSWIVAAIQPKNLISWAEYIDKERISINTEYGLSKKRIADEVTLDDNQVLMFYKLKQF